jgi:ABC-2 type transport system permease protein
MNSGSEFSLHRVWTMVIHELYVTKRSLEIFFDIVFFPLINVVLFGLISRFISKGSNSNQFLILGVLLWEIVTIVQYNVTVSTMWEVWSHNLTNIFMTPLSIVEYLAGHILVGVLKTAAVLVMLGLAAAGFFHFNLLDVGVINLLLFGINLAIFAVWIGIILLGFIFRFGTRMAAVSWGLIFLFQPLTAAFFPLSVLPLWLQHIAHAFPATYVFENARRALAGGSGILWSSFFLILAFNLAYTFVAVLGFQKLFEKSKDSGQFARNDLG